MRLRVQRCALLRYAALCYATLCFASLRSYGLPWPIRANRGLLCYMYRYEEKKALGFRCRKVEIARASVGGIISISLSFSPSFLLSYSPLFPSVLLSSLSCPPLLSPNGPFHPVQRSTHLLCRRMGACEGFAFTPSLAGVNQSLIPQRSSSERNSASTRSVIHPLVTFSLGLA